MDWRRAKSVLIISFLMLNVLLGSQLWLDWRERLNTSVDWTSLPPETLQIMRDKNIQVDDAARIPTETPVMRELTYTFKKRAGDGISDRTAITPPPETRIVYYEDELSTTLGGIITDLSKYKLDEPGRREGVFVFNRMEGAWPMFDIHLELFYSEQKIRSYSQDLIEIKPSGDAKEQQQVLPAAKALAKVIERNLPAGSVITEISLGYHGEIFDGAPAQVSTPSWRIVLENGEEVYYVNAISAEVTTEKGDASVTP
jgi:regulatory protein YycI of two-component signal transduction system YycFG